MLTTGIVLQNLSLENETTRCCKDGVNFKRERYCMAVSRDKEDMGLRFEDHDESSGEGLTGLLRGHNRYSRISMKIQS